MRRPIVNNLPPPGVALEIGHWESDPDFPVFPVGSKPKRMLRCPEVPREHFLIPGHGYLFKTARGWQAQQVWSEVIAYRLGRLIGIEVPPCFLAVDSKTGEVGALIEFFYGYPNEAEPARLIPAADLFARFPLNRRPQFDRKKGRPHGIRSNVRVCEVLGIPDVVTWWGRTLMFDALIGNTDRHPENWGFLVRNSGGSSAIGEFAPIFDNGTSLGYEIAPPRLGKMMDQSRMASYLQKGTHHCGWAIADDRPMPHVSLCEFYLKVYPAAVEAMKAVLSFDKAEFDRIVSACTNSDVNIIFTTERADFVSMLTENRRNMLRSIFGGCGGKLD